MLEEGTIITDLEGIDLGPDGAVVLEVNGDQVELVRLDTHEFLSVDTNEVDFAADEPDKGEGTNPYLYDPDAMDSPEIDNIRWLPTYWGPRDPNNPSSLTDVSWRPTQYWRRRQQIHGDTQMRNRQANLYPSMETVPHKEQLPQQYHQDYGLPRRMQVDRWEGEGKLEDLIALATEFWQGYREKRHTNIPQRGDRQSMEVYQWGIVFMERLGLERKEMNELYQFMVDTDVIPKSEYDEFTDALDVFALRRYDWV